MRRLVVLAPMTVELRAVVRALGLRHGVGRVGGAEVRAALGGVGPAAAAARAERAVGEWAPEWMAVVGIAGGVGSDRRIGDVVIPAEVEDHATGERFTPDAVPLVRGEGCLLTTDGLAPLNELEERHRRDGVVAVDMETAAVARVCSAAGIAWFAVRGVSDLAAEGLVDEATMALVRPDGRIDGRAVARTLLRRPPTALRMARLASDTRRATEVAAATAAAMVRDLGRVSGSR